MRELIALVSTLGSQVSKVLLGLSADFWVTTPAEAPWLCQEFPIVFFVYLFVCLFGRLVGFSRQGFSIVSQSVLELALLDQAGLKLTEICLPLPPKDWD